MSGINIVMGCSFGFDFFINDSLEDCVKGP
jgi:hypothetical protein